MFKKYISSISILCLLILPIVFAFNSSEAASSPSILQYLKSINPQTDWSIMARASLGEPVSENDAAFLKNLDGNSSNDFATYILAITSLGKDSRSFGRENLVYGLRQMLQNGQIGDETLISDDMFALIALRASGLPASDSLVAQEVNYIKNHQLQDSGWDWSASSTSSSADYTAMGIMALASAGISASDSSISDAVDFLIASQNNDGGFGMTKGQLSNTASTAWALSAIYALGDNPDFYKPAGLSPIDYLNARLSQSGYFLFDAQSSGPDLFTPVSSAYAAIALAGKFYPVSSITAPSQVSLRVEGQNETICDLKAAEGKTALDVIKSSAQECGYSYVIQDTQYGPYLTTIAQDAASGLNGWSYLPNFEMAQVGAGDYIMKPGDILLWYYGAWDDKPLRLKHAQSSVGVGDDTVATVEKYDSGAWSALAGAALKRGNEDFITDANGQVSLSWAKDGAYYIYAEAGKSVRSEKVMIVTGDAASSQSIDMSVIVDKSNPGSGSLQDTNKAPNSSIIFGVSGDLDFGTLGPGESSTKQAIIANSGTSNISATATISGAGLFTANTRLDNVASSQWQKVIASGLSSSVNVTLFVPSSYQGNGSEQGTIVFWANAVN